MNTARNSGTMRSSHPPLNSLATRWAACKGQVPPPLVGASIALVDGGSSSRPLSANVSAASGSAGRVFLFGGRLVSSRKMINDLYILDLDTREWRKVPLDNEFDENGNRLKPFPRYFHSCEVWNGKLLFFGGMGVVSNTGPTTTEAASSSRTDQSDGLSVLDEVVALDLNSLQWQLDFVRLDRSDQETDDAEDADPTSLDTARPQPRYAHLSSIIGDHMVIIGGQNMANKYVEEINVLDLRLRRWVLKQKHERQWGIYRSLAISSPFVIEGKSSAPDLADVISGRARAFSKSSVNTASSSLHPQNSFANGALSSPSISTHNEKASLIDRQQSSLGSKESLTASSPLPMSRLPRSDEVAQPMYIYSNYNFTDVKRELEVAKLSDPISNTDNDEAELSPQRDVNLEDRSKDMVGTTMPPGLRFPTGMIAGDHLLVAGTYLANTSQTFSVWSLSLDQMTWTRLDVGPLLSKGSWNKALMWPSHNRMVILGNRERDLVTDYNQRQNNWDHLLLLDLEAWGIGQPPRRPMTDDGIDMGLRKLAAAVAPAMEKSPSLHLSRSRNAIQSRAQFESHSGIRHPQQHAAGIAKHSASSDSLAATSAPFGSSGDFECVCSDGVRIGCHRAILEARWPWFKDRMVSFKRQARSASDVIRAKNPQGAGDFNPPTFSPTSINGGPLSGGSVPGSGPRTPITPGFTQDGMPVEDADPSIGQGLRFQVHNDCRFLPRELHIPEPSPVVLALLQFFYTRCICTPIQRHPAIVASLLILSRVYKMEETLGVWARHAASVLLGDELFPAHLRGIAQPPFASFSSTALTSSAQTDSAATSSRRADVPSSPPSSAANAIPLEECHRLAVVIYEAAGLAEYEPLQLRALRTVVFLSKALQQKGPSVLNSNTASSLPGAESSWGATGDVMSPSHSLSSVVSATGQQARRPSEPIRVATSSAVPLSTQIAGSNNHLPSPSRSARPISTLGPAVAADTRESRLAGFSTNRTAPQVSIGRTASPALPSEESKSGAESTHSERRAGSGLSGPSPLSSSLSSSYSSPNSRSIPAIASAPPLNNSAARSTTNISSPPGGNTGGSSRKRFSLFGRSNTESNAASSTVASSDPPGFEPQFQQQPQENRNLMNHNRNNFGSQGSGGMSYTGSGSFLSADSAGTPYETIEEETSRLSLGTASSGSTVAGTPVSGSAKGLSLP
ncbi:unnamed protein product [Sympodiomycopsis kandeliae]